MFAVYMFAFIACLATFGFAGFLFLTTTIRAMKVSLNSINKKSISHGDRVQIFEKLSEFIENHSIIRELRLNFIIAYKGSIITIKSIITTIISG